MHNYHCRLVLFLLFLCLILSACTEASSDVPAPPAPTSFSMDSLVLPEPACSDLKSAPVYFDGLLSDRAYWNGSNIYVSPALLASLAGSSCSTTVLSESVLLQFPTLTVHWEKGEEILLAGARYLYAPGGCLIIQDQLYLPPETISHLFSVAVSCSDKENRVDIDTAGLHLMADSTPDYYERNYSADDIYWLSRLIRAEAENEPLSGQIGVGNVVLNRVSNPKFPYTVLDVILEHSNATQFDSAAEGAILNDPSDRSVIAAYLCMEGFNTVDNSLYYVNPSVVDAGWFRNNLRLICIIGNHEFYGEANP